MRVLFTTLPAVGHFYPMVPLASALQAAGNSVLVATDPDFADIVTAAGIPAAPVLAPIDVVSLLRPGPPGPGGRTGPVRAAEYVGQRCAEAATRSLPALRSLVGTWRPDLVVAEPMEFAGPAAASAAGRSWARHWWGLAPDPEMIAVATAAVDEALAARGLPPLSAPVSTVDVCPALLQSPTALPATSMRYVPFSGATRIPDWLLAEPDMPRVCLTLGTLLPRRDPQRSEIWRLVLRVLAELNHEVVVAIGRKHVPLLGELPHGVRAEPVPLSGLLPTCSALVHHGGSGGTMAAVTHGVPQLIIPHFADQFNNAHRLRAVGAGLELPKLVRDPEVVRTACRVVVGDGPHRTAARDLAKENRSRPSPAAVAADLAACVGEPGPERAWV